MSGNFPEGSQDQKLKKPDCGLRTKNEVPEYTLQNSSALRQENTPNLKVSPDLSMRKFLTPTDPMEPKSLKLVKLTVQEDRPAPGNAAEPQLMVTTGIHVSPSIIV